MSKAFTLNHLTEGIKDRNNSAEGQRLVEKWTRTGLLRGLESTKRDNMARLLENQAAQVLREVNSLGNGGGATTSSGDIRGFANIAFPIVRRVFGGLVANELVSIQPMSLPSGLLFYLDYTYGTNVGGDVNLQTGGLGAASARTYTAGQSIYNNPTGKGIRSGSLAAGGQYDLVGTSYSQVHQKNAAVQLWTSGAFGGSSVITTGRAAFATGSDGKLLQFDPQITNFIEANSGGAGATAGDGVYSFAVLRTTGFTGFDPTQVKDVSVFSTTAAATLGLATIGDTIQGGTNILNVRRLNQLGTFSGGVFTPNPLVDTAASNAAILTVVSGVFSVAASVASGPFLSASYVISDALNVDNSDASALTIPVFESDFGGSGISNATQPIIPEIDIKIESIAVTATTRKLRARWSPELAQDLNAYHSMDAEVELTQILSEQIALEIDREILNDLLTQANGANYYWSRAPGRFVNKTSGAEVLQGTNAPGPQFTGTVREWYETLI